MDDQQRARELEAVAERNLRSYVTRHVPAGMDRVSALLCIDTLAALRAAPEGFVLVPVELSKHMEDEFRDALWIDSNRHGEDVISGISDAWGAALAARPQGVK